MLDTFARRLVNARKIRCMSQKELSDRLDGHVSVDTLEKFETAQRMPSEDVLVLLMHAPRFNMDYFFRPFKDDLDIYDMAVLL